MLLMRPNAALLILLFLIPKLETAEKPPNIYEWIEENAHICTSIPSEGRNIVNFLTPNEGSKCSLCPETPKDKIPTSACAVELSPNEVDVEIGCHPVPELCILELRTRFEDLFSGTKLAGANFTLGNRPQEEDIFMAKSNPFDSNLVATLGRSSNNSRTTQFAVIDATTTPASTIQPFETTTPQPFETSHELSVIQIDDHSPAAVAAVFATTESQPEVPTSVPSPLRHNPSHSLITQTPQHRFEPTTTAETDNDLIQIDADSGDFVGGSTTVRANVFSVSSNEGAPIRIAGRLNEIAKQVHVSVPMISSRLPITDIPTPLPLNKEVMPHELPKLNPSKSLFEKRAEFLTTSRSRPSSTPASPQFSNNLWALFRSQEPLESTTSPVFDEITTLTDTSSEFSQSVELPTTKKTECKDSNLLCCFWAIAGECDSNPFWMRIHCSKTCGTCGCLLTEADRCVSTGINCTIPTTTTTPLTTRPLMTTTTASRTTKRTTAVFASTSRLTPPPKFSRFTAKARNLPRWKIKPLDTNPVNPPAFQPNSNKDESSISNQVLKNITPRVSVSSEYAESDYAVKVSSSSREIVHRPSIQGPTSTSAEDSLKFAKMLSTVASSTQVTTITPSNCFNYNRLCQFWADLGECIRNPFWMRPHCQLACQSCGETLLDVFAPKSKPNCVNQAVLCPFWAFIGECARNPRWMLVHCAPSCQVC